jgi:hypothetical protein
VEIPTRVGKDFIDRGKGAPEVEVAVETLRPRMNSIVEEGDIAHHCIIKTQTQTVASIPQLRCIRRNVHRTWLVVRRDLHQEHQEVRQASTAVAFTADTRSTTDAWLELDEALVEPTFSRPL